ncbi:hypothetical protein HPB50_014999 [Hyalomma asiaticum]|uniref:Uncharacterized protein n=1 Tax=Hyalomma asiaticum TaxID=266040 RepID=A0ACB7SU74_HYAAI|nr:hypothetical protein HPB50_014999 [Hyalomma asiaticum]
MSDKGNVASNAAPQVQSTRTQTKEARLAPVQRNAQSQSRLLLSPAPAPQQHPVSSISTAALLHHRHCHSLLSPSQPQTTRPSAPSFSSNSPQNRPQHPVVTLATHDYGARAAAAMMPLRHLHHLHHHHHHSRFVPASSGGVVPAASSPAGDLVVALSTTSPS